jgi:hypothetical protein
MAEEVIAPEEKGVSATSPKKKKKKTKKKWIPHKKAPSSSTHNQGVTSTLADASLQEDEEDNVGVDDVSDKSPESEISTITSSTSTTTVTRDSTDFVDPISTQSQKKKEKKQQKALDRKRALDTLAIENTSSSSTSSTSSTTGIVPPTPHPLLAPTDILRLSSSTHYDVLVNLLDNTLTPTVRYEDIKSALEGLGILVEARGNGDYRKITLPNGRKIFIYKPAVPQVGKRFLKTLREGLLDKWGLTVAHLNH